MGLLLAFYKLSPCLQKFKGSLLTKPVLLPCLLFSYKASIFLKALPHCYIKAPFIGVWLGVFFSLCNSSYIDVKKHWIIICLSLFSGICIIRSLIKKKFCLLTTVLLPFINIYISATLHISSTGDAFWFFPPFFTYYSKEISPFPDFPNLFLSSHSSSGNL